jgi:uncharacterized membrane protein YphA (DoxX/SURF4 family)
MARLIVGGLFLISAVGKIMIPEDFAEEIRAYEMVPVVATNAVAYILPWLEGLAGFLLIVGVWRSEARLVIAAMLVVFTIAKAYTFAEGKRIDCGCGGTIHILKYIYNSPQGILTNLVLLGLLWIDWHAQRLSRKGGSAVASARGPKAGGRPESA